MLVKSCEGQTPLHKEFTKSVCYVCETFVHHRRTYALCTGVVTPRWCRMSGATPPTIRCILQPSIQLLRPLGSYSSSAHEQRSLSLRDSLGSFLLRCKAIRAPLSAVLTALLVSCTTAFALIILLANRVTFVRYCRKSFIHTGS